MSNLSEKISMSAKWRGIVRCTLHNVITGEIQKSEWYNLITNVGRAAIARRLANEGLKANEGAITYGEVGTNATPAASGDTDLIAPIERKAVSAISVSGSVANIQIFYNTSEANGNLREFGLFGEDADLDRDPIGTLFNRVNFVINKTSADTLTIDVEITIL